jgi:hypothetical protein
MEDYRNDVVTINFVEERTICGEQTTCYRVTEDSGEWLWSNDMFSELVEKNTVQTVQEESIPEVFEIFNEIAYTSAWSALERGYI